MSEGKRYAKIGDLVIHRHSGEIGRVVKVHEPNGYEIEGKPVSCPVAVIDSGAPFLDVPGRNAFEFLPESVQLLNDIECLREIVDATISDAIRGLSESHGIDEHVATLVVGSVIRDRMRKTK